MTLIITHRINPPIPTRNCDWCAYIDGTEELGLYGYGATEAEAIADLKDLLGEDNADTVNAGSDLELVGTGDSGGAR